MANAVKTRNQIIQTAFRKVGVYSPTNEEVENAANIFLDVLNSIQTLRDLIWKTQENTSTLTTSSIVKNNSKSYRCILGHTSGASSEPGVGANSTTYWIEITYDATHTAWVTATAYTSNNEISLGATVIDVDSVFVRSSGNTDNDIQLISYSEYADLPDKALQGLPTHAYLKKDGSISSGLNALTLVLYPHPDVTTYVIHHRDVINITESESNNTALDTLKRWNLALTYAVAAELADEYDPDRKDTLQKRATKEIDRQLMFYSETDEVNSVEGYF